MQDGGANSGKDGANWTVGAAAGSHTIGFALEPREGFESWLAEMGTRLQERRYGTGFVRETIDVPGCGLFIATTRSGDSVPQYRLSTEEPVEALLNSASLFVPTGIYRLDIALDYDADLSGCEFAVKGAQYRTEYRSGRLQSVYFGKRTSERFFRVYDRAARGKRGDTGWRVELEWKPKKDHYELPETLFDALDVRYYPPRGKLKVRDEAMLFYLSHHPDAERSLSYGTRQNIKLLREQHSVQLSPSPSTLYRSVRAGIQADISRMLSMPQVSPPPVVLPRMS